ncbi:hypothetical protein DFH08DRAFT_1013985 [Mycena albidolilacea]|uniref:Uncharacterized protein n=1 Tax=Mycena albidolilacea TaxID=1033008 RepID=A0AAD6ZUP1_9AGAR|nr:hypothetical protein DFH08DRAFT_1013985 [Mycena albidolilacea]
MTHQAEIHLVKSEYHEAYKIQTQILQECLLHMDPYAHGLALLNLAQLSLSMNARKNAAQQEIERAMKIFLASERIVEIAILNDSDIKSYCLERLGNTGHWSASSQMSSWTTVYLAHSIKLKEKLGINKALQFLGDIFLAQADEDTAASLFIVALEGYTYMDVHCSRAECMLRLGDVAREHDDLHKAAEFWDAARPLFERSSQTKQMQDIDERLASVGEDVLFQHRMNLACLMEINALTRIVEEAEDSLSDIEDLQQDLGGVQSLVTV